jgi:hypothetical protein
MSELSAYEKMFEDGTAFNPIKIEQPTPDNPGGGMGRGADPDNPGVDMSRRPDPDDNGVDYSLFDNHMGNMIQEKIEAKKAAAGGNPARPDPPQAGGDRIIRLERRIELLEQALSLVMETQTKLMRG